MQKLILTLTLVFAATCGVQAETIVMDPVVVTATRTETPLSQVGSSVTVITAEEIEEKQETQVLEILRSVPGVNIYSYGTLGSTSNISLRGTDNKHTLVLIDGIEFRDASTTSGGPQLENLSTDNIERIEIVRGAQSVLYGSDAIGGIINIITKKGSEKPNIYASVEGGSYKTIKGQVGASHAGEKGYTSISASKLYSDGYSAANEKYGNKENDGYKNTSFSLNTGISPVDTVDFNVNFNAYSSEYEFDAAYPFADSTELQKNDEIYGRASGTIHLLDDNWLLTLGMAITDTQREIEGTYPAQYDGTIIKYDLQNTISVNDQNKLVLGLETEKESAEIVSSINASGNTRTNSAYLEDQITMGAFAATVGVRLDHHETFGSHTTYRFAPTYNFAKTETRIKGSVGTGFRAPSLFELYGAPATYDWGTAIYQYQNGNEDLSPEKSFSWDVGIEQYLLDQQIQLEVTYFYNDIDDYIEGSHLTSTETVAGVTTYTYETINIANLKTQGVETVVSLYPCDFFDATLSYTYTDSKQDDGSRKDRLPIHKGSLSANIYPTPELTITPSILYVGERNDTSYLDWSPREVTLKEYVILNLAASYQINEYLKVFGRIHNLLDKNYEEVADYGTAGASGYLGLKASF